jgi:hypothetical protein
MSDEKSVEKELSTTSLSKELNKSSQDLFKQLADMGLIIRNGNNWDLTASGRVKGGLYREHDKYGRYIVWPYSIKAELDGSLSESGQHLLTSTAIGKHFEISATRTNSILSELGLIEKGVKGWVVTDLVKRFGAVQAHEKVSGVPYVRWPESITQNKMFIASIQSVKGDIPVTDFAQPQNPAQGEVEFRDKFKPNLRATDGHYVRSKAELLIDNWLYMSGLVHAYERKLPIGEEKYCDFYLPTGKVYIEYWGLEDNPTYAARKEEKIKIYKENGLHLIQLTEKDVQNLDDNLPRLLLEFNIKTD